MLTFDLPKVFQFSNDNNGLGLLDNIHWKESLSLISYGVQVGIRINKKSVLDAFWDYLPPNWQPSPSSVVDELYSLIVSGSDSFYSLYRGEELISESPEIEDILEAFDSDLRLQIGTLVKDQLFVHAGVVEWRGQAIVIPGRSFSGKTTLVAALVKAGAIYYSDEYAVLDLNGWVHSYPRTLSIRQGEGQRTKRCPVEALGGIAGEKPIPIGLIVQTQYQSGAQWSPQKISAGQAVLTLLDNTLVARLRPEFALPILGKAVSSAVILKSQRGEAEETTKALLQYFDNLMNFNSEDNHHDTCS
jgi:hypothetical protein